MSKITVLNNFLGTESTQCFQEMCQTNFHAKKKKKIGHLILSQHTIIRKGVGLNLVFQYIHKYSDFNFQKTDKKKQKTTRSGYT